ncbi:MAG: accessory gene regulator B family protein [Candidatus Woesebacteria bacterium]|jgi:hypothetical protein
MEFLQQLLQKAFVIDSIWSIIIRGIIWLVIAIVILVSVDNPDERMTSEKLKSNLGFLLIFMLVSGGLIYLLFSFNSTAG